ncbi:hypothetical protein MOB40_11700 [Bacillus inaquosorum]|uniref:hypothetical protein n=1 Tax=Bacillus inaquosorum TaxID=483913 RepID=UPI00227EAEBF|nr:hypothetical protein [Bacillus inaquosorum]MCY7905568.1 hypothetical protein [Bacillus inaquosorum]MCY7929469.1 hypothetical protein [Bacillus inaquosorum]MCY8768526.1 hypothetical protein [Bacillus inaquosorum]MCY9049667.1 hypothetical protein [Bacillus inaquosorum]
MKKRMIAIALLILAGIALFVFVSPLKSHKAVSQQDLRDPDFLDNKDTLLYFSTSADQDAFGSGKSYVLFISRDGSLSSFKMKGLELGSAKVHGESVMLEDKNTIYTIKDCLSSHKRAYQHTGDSAGFLQNTDGFYTLYNSGYDKKGDGYRSELYRQIDGEWKKDVIPYYIRASGFHNGAIYALIPTADEKGYQLLQIQADQKKLTYHTITEWQYREGASVESQLAVDDQAVYFMVRGQKARNLYQMVKINKKSGEVELHDIAEYKNDEQTIYSSMPFSFKRSFFPYDGHLYFIDGFGKGYKIDAKTGKTSTAFTLSRDKMKADFREITQKGSSLYFFTYSYNKPAYIEQYSLKTGKKVKEKEIGKVKEIVTPKSHLKLYDFEVMKGF